MKPKSPKAPRHQLHVRLDKWTPARVSRLREAAERCLKVTLSTSQLVEMAMGKLETIYVYPTPDKS